MGGGWGWGATAKIESMCQHGDLRSRPLIAASVETGAGTCFGGSDQDETVGKRPESHWNKGKWAKAGKAGKGGKWGKEAITITILCTRLN